MTTKRVALITDVTHFVGEPSAKALIAEGIAVYGIDPSFGDKTARAAFTSKVPGIQCLEINTAKETIGKIIKAEGQLDILVNNDAYPPIKARVEEARPEDLRATFEALVFKGFEMAAAAIPHMKQRQVGKILFVTSATALTGMPAYSMYTSSRAAANAIAHTLALELAASNIQVNAMAPNFVQNPDYYPPELMAKPEAAKKILAQIPLGRLAKPEEAAALVSFLVGPQSDFITGQTIPFAGGSAIAR